MHLWSGSDPFSHQTGKVTSSRGGRIGIDVGQTGTCPAICPAPNGFYYLFGTRNALDVERELFYDVNSTTLYFMAPGGGNPNNVDVRSKRRLYAFDLRGKKGVTIANISIFASTIITDELSSLNTLDRIHAKYVSRFTALPQAADDPNGDKYSILQVHRSDTGIIISGTGNTVENSTIEYSAGAGIALEGMGNVVRNNLIHHIDYIGNYSSGINLNGNYNTIQFNTISDVGRQGIVVNAVQNQDIRQTIYSMECCLAGTAQKSTACCNQSASGTRIHHNWLHDTLPVIEGQGDNNALAGVMIDNGSGGFNVDQNVLW